MNKAPRVIWSIRDGKAGHTNQISGLVQALNTLGPVQEYPMTVPMGSPLLAWVKKSFPNPEKHPEPDLIIGAGHRTHLAVLAAKRTFGGHAIILMSPSLPKNLFDLCIVPEHDQIPAGKHVFVTRGAINTIQYQTDKNHIKGLMLIGGPTRYYDWDDDAVISQLIAIIKKDADIHWTVLTSRRTPAHFLTQLNSIEAPLTVYSPEHCNSEQYRSELEKSHTVWATQDSVSMIYEALTSGAAVGILNLPIKQQGRPVKAIQKLITDSWVTRHSDWLNGMPLTPAPEQLNEAARCANEIIHRWPNH